jgi:hypothetical protein
MKSKWGCVLTTSSGCFMPNCISETIISQGKAGYIIISTIFCYVWIFFEYQYIVLYNKGKGVWIL